MMDENMILQLMFEAVFAGGECLRARNLLSRLSEGKCNEEPDGEVGRLIKSVLDKSGYAVFSEEVDNSAMRSQQEYFWWVDPIDGTRGYLAGEKDYGISVGFVAQAKFPVLGAVYQLEYDKLFYAFHEQGAYVKDLFSHGDRRLRVNERALEGLVGILGTQSTQQMRLLYSRLGLSECYGPIGSFTAKVLALVEGRGDVYLKSGNKCNEWDSCAVDVILREAGGKMTDLGGNRLIYNKIDPNFDKGILASNGSCHELMLERLQHEF